MTEPIGMRWRVTRAVRASRLPAPSKLIMLTLADIAGDGLVAAPSLSQLARETGLSRSSITRHLSILETGKWLARMRPAPWEGVNGETTQYRLIVAGEARQSVLPTIEIEHDSNLLYDVRKRGIVYYLTRSDGAVKIGTTRSYNSRIRRLRKQHGPLSLIHWEWGSFELEAQRHEQFSDLRIDPTAEWFHLEGDLLDFVLYSLAVS